MYRAYKVEWQEHKDDAERMSRSFDRLEGALDLYRDKSDGNYYVNLSQTLMQNYKIEGLHYNYIENEKEDEIEQHPIAFTIKCIKDVEGSFTKAKEYKVLNINGEYRSEDDDSLAEDGCYHIVKELDEDSSWFNEHFEVVNQNKE